MSGHHRAGAGGPCHGHRLVGDTWLSYLESMGRGGDEVEIRRARASSICCSAPISRQPRPRRSRPMAGRRQLGRCSRRWGLLKGSRADARDTVRRHGRWHDWGRSDEHNAASLWSAHGWVRATAWAVGAAVVSWLAGTLCMMVGAGAAMALELGATRSVGIAINWAAFIFISLRTAHSWRW